MTEIIRINIMEIANLWQIEELDFWKKWTVNIKCFDTFSANDIIHEEMKETFYQVYTVRKLINYCNC